MARRERGLRLPLYISVFMVFLFLIGAIVGGLSWYLYRASTHASLANADRLLAEVSDKIGERTRRMLGAVEVMVDTTVALPYLQDKAELLQSPMLPYMMRLLDSHSGLYAAILGFEDGDFLQVVVARGADLMPVLEAFGAPIGTRYVHRVIARDGIGQRREFLHFLGPAGNSLGLREGVPDFDPRTRPWYGTALESGRREVTEPYGFASLSTLGITVSHRFEGPVAGVFGLDMTLDGLSDFLAVQEVSPNAALAIVDGEGHLLAHTDPSAVLHDMSGGEGGTRIHVRDLAMPVLERMHQELRPDIAITQRNYRFRIEGSDYLGAATELQLGDGWEAVLLVAAPVEDFVGPIERVRRDGLVAAGGALLFALPLIWLASRRIAAPLSALAQEAWRIRKLDLEAPVSVRSFILEIERLAQSVSAMKGALSVFARYVPRGLVEQIMAEGGHRELGGERREVTIMFSDITGFTAQSEKLPPEELMERTSRYFEEITVAIADHGGVVDKYIGDAVMALWNAPRADPDHIAKACRAVLAAQERLADFNRALQAQGQEPMTTRFGLHTGICVIGNVGSSDRMSYTAIGANVNLAARLEGLGRHYGTGILVSEAIRTAVEPDFLFRPIARVRPKGVARPIAVHELLAERDAAQEHRIGDMLSAWEGAMALRDQGDFAAAAERFAVLAAANPGDAVAARAHGLCLSLAARQPVNWDGVEVFNEK